LQSKVQKKAMTRLMGLHSKYSTNKAKQM
jgi:hypothetical protein